jgi:hypothetical protein
MGLAAWGEIAGRWTPLGGGIQAWDGMWPWLIFWWSAFVIAGWAVWLFAHHLEHALVASRGQTAALAQTLNALAAGADLEHFLAQALAAITEPLGARHTSLFLHAAAQEVIRQEATFTGGETWLARTHAERLLPHTPASVVNGQWIVIAGGPTADDSMSNRVDIFTP